MATTTSEPLFSIDAFVRRSIRVFGTVYELKHPDELSIIENRRVGTLGETVDNAPDDIDDAGAAVVAGALASMCELVLLAPPEVHARLADGQRLKIVQAFSGLQRETAPAAVSPTVQGSEPTATAGNERPAEPPDESPQTSTGEK